MLSRRVKLIRIAFFYSAFLFRVDKKYKYLSRFCILCNLEIYLVKLLKVLSDIILSIYTDVNIINCLIKYLEGWVKKTYFL